MTDDIDKFITFLKDNKPFPNNGWFVIYGYECYFRKTTRYIPNIKLKTLDFASISKIKNKLHPVNLIKLLKIVEKQAINNSFKCIYIENVLNKQLAEMYYTIGYTHVKVPFEIIPCFYKLISKINS